MTDIKKHVQEHIFSLPRHLLIKKKTLRPLIIIEQHVNGKSTFDLLILLIHSI